MVVHAFRAAPVPPTPPEASSAAGTAPSQEGSHYRPLLMCPAAPAVGPPKPHVEGPPLRDIPAPTEVVYVSKLPVDNVAEQSAGNPADVPKSRCGPPPPPCPTDRASANGEGAAFKLQGFGAGFPPAAEKEDVPRCNPPSNLADVPKPRCGPPPPPCATDRASVLLGEGAAFKLQGLGPGFLPAAEKEDVPRCNPPLNLTDLPKPLGATNAHVPVTGEGAVFKVRVFGTEFLPRAPATDGVEGDTQSYRRAGSTPPPPSRTGTVDDLVALPSPAIPLADAAHVSSEHPPAALFAALFDQKFPPTRPGVVFEQKSLAHIQTGQNSAEISDRKVAPPRQGPGFKQNNLAAWAGPAAEQQNPPAVALLRKSHQTPLAPEDAPGAAGPAPAGGGSFRGLSPLAPFLERGGGEIAPPGGERKPAGGGVDRAAVAAGGTAYRPVVVNRPELAAGSAVPELSHGLVGDHPSVASTLREMCPVRAKCSDLPHGLVGDLPSVASTLREMCPVRAKCSDMPHGLVGDLPSVASTLREMCPVRTKCSDLPRDLVGEACPANRSDLVQTLVGNPPSAASFSHEACPLVPENGAASPRAPFASPLDETCPMQETRPALPPGNGQQAVGSGGCVLPPSSAASFASEPCNAVSASSFPSDAGLPRRVHRKSRAEPGKPKDLLQLASLPGISSLGRAYLASHMDDGAASLLNAACAASHTTFETSPSHRGPPAADDPSAHRCEVARVSLPRSFPPEAAPAAGPAAGLRQQQQQGPGESPADEDVGYVPSPPPARSASEREGPPEAAVVYAHVACPTTFPPTLSAPPSATFADRLSPGAPLSTTTDYSQPPLTLTNPPSTSTRISPPFCPEPGLTQPPPSSAVLPNQKRRISPLFVADPVSTKPSFAPPRKSGPVSKDSAARSASQLQQKPCRSGAEYVRSLTAHRLQAAVPSRPPSKLISPYRTAGAPSALASLPLNTLAGCPPYPHGAGGAALKMLRPLRTPIRTSPLPPGATPGKYGIPAPKRSSLRTRRRLSGLAIHIADPNGAPEGWRAI
ncbi:hypothetical protein DIPPA_19751 [Diplonema papillatum]|nr:hypothetical protein DIPPA_19751 [Diplonema papillatum]